MSGISRRYNTSQSGGAWTMTTHPVGAQLRTIQYMVRRLASAARALAGGKYTVHLVLSCMLCVLGIVSVLYMSERGYPAASYSSFNGYTVLFVDSGVDSSIVCAALEAAGVNDYISSTSQGASAMLIEDSPLPRDMKSETPMASDSTEAIMRESFALQSMAVMNSDYMERRQRYFIDSSGEYALYYVNKQRTNMASLRSAIKQIQCTTDKCSIVTEDKKAIALIVLVVSLLFAILSHTCLPYIMPVVWVMRASYPVSGLASVLMLCALFAARNLWDGRRHSVRVTMQHGTSWILAMAAVGVAAAGGFLLCGVLTLLSSVMIMRSEHLLKRATLCCRLFTPVPIKAASSHIRYEKTALIAGCAASVVLSVMARQSSGQAALNMPMPVIEMNRQDLPTLDDYCAWCYDCITYPYTRLTSDARDGVYYNGGAVTFPTYKEAGGVITSEIKEIKADDDFRAWCIGEIDALPPNNIEHLMKSACKTQTASSANRWFARGNDSRYIEPSYQADNNELMGAQDSAVIKPHAQGLIGEDSMLFTLLSITAFIACLLLRFVEWRRRV